MRLLLYVMLVLSAFSHSGYAATLPTFDDFRVKSEYHGPLARPILNSDQSKAYRTRLVDGSRGKPNFAGGFHMIIWGCGTSCVQGAVVNAATGQVTFIPFSICCYVGPMDAPDWYSVDFRVTSALVIFHGQRNEEGVNGDHYYVFDGGSFRFLATREVKEQPTPPAKDPGAAATAQGSSAPDTLHTASGLGTVVKAIPGMFQGTWKLQAGSLTPCSSKQPGDEEGQNTATIDAKGVQLTPDNGRFQSGTIRTSETPNGYSIDSFTVNLNYGDEAKEIQTETWSVKDVSGQKVLIILRERNMTFDLLTKCQG